MLIIMTESRLHVFAISVYSHIRPRRCRNAESLLQHHELFLTIVIRSSKNPPQALHARLPGFRRMRFIVLQKIRLAQVKVSS